MNSLRASWFPVLLGMIILVVTLSQLLFAPKALEKKSSINSTSDSEWQSPDINLVPFTHEGDLIRYGRDLIVNTSKYFGPKGIVAQITNGMNCQNCHLEAGTRSFGNSFAAVASVKPITFCAFVVATKKRKTKISLKDLMCIVLKFK